MEQLTDYQKSLIVDNYDRLMFCVYRYFGKLSSADRCLQYQDKQEILSRFNFGICKAAKSYDSSRGTSFVTWCYWYLKDVCCKFFKEKNTCPLSFKGLLLSDSDMPYDELLPYTPLTSRDLYGNLFDLKSLTELEKKILKLYYIKENTLEEVGVLLKGYSKQRVLQIKQQAERKIEHYIKRIERDI